MSPAHQGLRQVAFAVAYRILGNAPDAEDIAQDCAAHLMDVDPPQMDNPPAYVATMAARRSFNMLRNTRTRANALVRYALPTPLTMDHSPGADARLDLSYGLIVLFQSLPPLARAVYILRSAFDLSFDEIARALDRTPAGCRQAHSRAAKSLKANKNQIEAKPPSSEVVEKLVASVLAGDIKGLTNLLSKEIIMHSDGGGIAPDLGRPIGGRDRIAQFLSASPKLLGVEPRFRAVDTCQGTLMLAEQNGKLILVVAGQTQEGKLTALYAISDPVKLAQIQASLISTTD